MEKCPGEKPQRQTHVASLWHLADVIAAVKGQLVSKASKTIPITGVCYLQKQMKPGDLVLTQSPKVWGCKYSDTRGKVDELLEAGAAAVITDVLPVNLSKNGTVILVNNTYDALHDLAVTARTRFQGKVIAVTGAVGKSSTKECLLHALGEQASTFATNKNFNTAIGVRLSLAQTPADFTYAIYEFSSDLPEKTLPKAQVLKPHLAVFTEIQLAHVSIYPTLEAIADQKSLLFNALEPEGVAILNQDTPCFDRLLANAKKNKVAHYVTFGATTKSDVQLCNYQLYENKSEVAAKVYDQSLCYELSLPGKHMIMNSLAVLAVTKVLGADLRKTAMALQKMPPIARHICKKRTPFRDQFIDVIDDSHNNTPAALRAAFAYLKIVTPGLETGRKLAFLGDIRQMGENAPQIHADLCEPIIESGIHKVFTLGCSMKNLYANLPEPLRGYHMDMSMPKKSVRVNEDIHPLIDAVLNELQPGDVILVKASSYMRPYIKMLLGKLCTL